MTESRPFCTFFLGPHYCGIDVRIVQEVNAYREVTCVPLAPPAVRGLMNLRGQIVTAIDLRHRLGLSERADPSTAVNVVVQTPDGAVSLSVDEIGDVTDVAAYAFERPPETLRGPARDLIAGAYVLPDRLLLILDSERILALADARGPERAG